MERKVSNQIKDLIAKEKDSLYVIKDDFFTGVNEITEKENSFAKKFMDHIGSEKDDQEELVIVLQPFQLHNFLINIHRSVLKS